jgi:hypothetical protein
MDFPWSRSTGVTSSRSRATGLRSCSCHLRRGSYSRAAADGLKALHALGDAALVAVLAAYGDTLGEQGFRSIAVARAEGHVRPHGSRAGTRPEPARYRVCDNRRWTTPEGDRPGAGGVVAGSDVNEGMLEVAAATATDLPVRIEWHRADATALPLPDGAFDVVCCQQGLQLGAPLAALDEEPRRALARELDQTLGEWADDDGLVFPMQTWLATARR